MKLISVLVFEEEKKFENLILNGISKVFCLMFIQYGCTAANPTRPPFRGIGLRD